jgi:hypothetical protein
MTSGRLRRWDPLVLTAVAITVLMTGAALQISREQQDPVAWWLVAGLVIAALLGAYGVARPAPARQVAVIGAGVILLALGLLGILTIGLPLLGAGGLMVVSLARSAGRPAEPVRS